MKCLTIAQPWAHGIVYGPKRVENRTWPTSYRGPLLIHAGRTKQWLGTEGDTLPDLPAYGQLTYGAILGVCRLIDCVRVERAPPGPFTSGPWCWLLSDVEAFEHPIKYTGALGLFDVPDEMILEHTHRWPLPGGYYGPDQLALPGW